MTASESVTAGSTGGRRWSVDAILGRDGVGLLARQARTVLLSVSRLFTSGQAASAPRAGAVAAATPLGRGSFEETVLPHLDAAYSLARFLTRDPDAADDIVQEAFLRAFRSFDGFRGGDPRAWLLAIVRNGVRDWASASSRNRARFEPLAVPGEDGGDAGEHADLSQDRPDEAVLRGDEAGLVRKVVEALPETFREVLVLREFDDLSYREIAEVTATPIGTVMSRLARARAMFGAAWRRHDGGDQP